MEDDVDQGVHHARLLPSLAIGLVGTSFAVRQVMEFIHVTCADNRLVPVWRAKNDEAPRLDVGFEAMEYAV
ncbi:hypothetical protein AB0D34_46020 [Streptomyces sp. NPDC048420]|uniref:hypothetical protein n=1 Tax=Streptomyces sp. NPDC048420 TaxID=3155755 RepID=UPI00343952CB